MERDGAAENAGLPAAGRCRSGRGTGAVRVADVVSAPPAGRDGILSRRDLETRRRILKDSHCGAFAVICMVLLAMTQWSAFLSMETAPLLPLALIPVSSRAAAAVAVLTLQPMRTSQYSAMERGGAPVFMAAALLAAACALPIVLWDSFAPLAAAIGYGLAVWYGFRQFEGMSGDISGFGLVLGELCGAVLLALGR